MWKVTRHPAREQYRIYRKVGGKTEYLACERDNSKPRTFATSGLAWAAVLTEGMSGREPAVCEKPPRPEAPKDPWNPEVPLTVHQVEDVVEFFSRAVREMPLPRWRRFLRLDNRLALASDVSRSVRGLLNGRTCRTTLFYYDGLLSASNNHASEAIKFPRAAFKWSATVIFSNDGRSHYTSR